MVNWTDILERAGWTFVQGALGSIATVPLITDLAGWEALAVAAASGGIASVVSFLKTLAQERLDVPDTRA
jgi:hypothetical protein